MKKLVVLFFITLLLSMSSLTSAFQQKAPKTKTTPTKNVEVTTQSSEKHKSMCSDCKHDSTCSKKDVAKCADCKDKVTCSKKHESTDSKKDAIKCDGCTDGSECKS